MNRRPPQSRFRQAFLVAALSTSACDQSALALTERGSAVTDYSLSAIDHQPHTIAARVSFQYPHSYHNVIFGADATNDFRIEKVESGSHAYDPPRLRVTYGGQSRTYVDQNGFTEFILGFEADRWYDLAVTVDSSNVVRVYIDGTQAGVEEDGPLVLPLGTWASGNLTFGEGATVDFSRQFYGLIDDVRIWERALTGAEVEALAAGTLPADPPTRSWAFDAPANLPTMLGNATVEVLTGSEDWSELQPTPQHAPLQLPLEGDLYVVQGVDSPAGDSHRGYAAFALDLVNHAGPTRGMDVLAMAPGTVVFVRTGSPDDVANQTVPGCTPCATGQTPVPGALAECVYLPNAVVIDHGNGLFTESIHFIPGSTPSSVQVGSTVQTGDVLGQVGKSGTGGDHLHFGVASKVTLPSGPNPSPSIGLDVPVPGGCGYYPAVRNYGIVTRAFVFDAYERWTGTAWEVMQQTTPSAGDVIGEL